MWKFSGLVCYFLSSMLMCSCNNSDSLIQTNYESAINLNSSKKQIQLSIIDTLIIDASNTSLSGEWIIIDSNLIYLDKHIVTIKKYNLNGELIDALFSRGRGPKEFLSPPICFTRLPHNKYLYIDRDSYFFILDTLFNKQLKINLIEKVAKSCNMEDLYNNPDPNNISMYEMSIRDNQFIVFGENIIFPITTEHIKYNGYYKKNNAINFYKQSFTLLTLDIHTLNPIHLFANFPPIYRDKIIPNFKECNISANDSILFVSYQADPNIYLYNKQLELFGYFGKSADIINSNYPQTKTFEEAELNYKRHRQENGYYSEIKSIQKYLFRNYIGSGNKLGLQIYQDYGIVYDSLLPYDIFEMIGYIEPYFYAITKCDSENETYNIIRLKIDYYE